MEKCWKWKTLALAICGMIPSWSVADDLAWLDAYNVVWDSQSRNSSESMPCGGGETGMNVWVENGDLLIYVQRSGCFDENNQYLKLGRLRVRMDPSPFADGAAFRQELKLRDGHVEITAGVGESRTQILVWAEVHRPVVHVEVNAAKPVTVTAAYESWRTEDLSLPNNDARPRFACLGWDGFPGEIFRYKDEIRHAGDAVFFHHRNRDDKLLIDYTIRQQGLEAAKKQIVNTQKGRTFGGVLLGEGFVAAGRSEGNYVRTPYKAWQLKSAKPGTRHHLRLLSHVAQTPSLKEWQDALAAMVKADKTTLDEARARTRQWWVEFWNRSRIVIFPGKAVPGDRAWRVARNYQLFRYQLACNAYGDYPTKFNGGNFTFDPSLVEKSGISIRTGGPGAVGVSRRRTSAWCIGRC